MDFRIWLGWHQPTERIYAAMETVDNVYVNQYRGRKIDGIPFGIDFMDFAVDGDHSGVENDSWARIKASFGK